MPYGTDMTKAELRQELKRHRGAMTRAALAAGISKQHLSNFLSGHDQLSLKAAVRLVRHLRRQRIKVDVAELASEEASHP